MNFTNAFGKTNNNQIVGEAERIIVFYKNDLPIFIEITEKLC